MSPRRNQNRFILLCIVFITFILTLSCSAVKSPVNTSHGRIAIKGYDPVAYFTMGRPVMGIKQFAFEWNEAKWLFSSMEHLRLFSAHPEQYAPQYGGY